MHYFSSDESASAARQTFVFSATLTLVPPVPLRVLKKKKKIIQPNQNTKLGSVVTFNMQIIYIWIYHVLMALLDLEGFLTSIGVKDGPKIVDITRKLGTVETLTEARINCTHEEKDYFLYYFLTRYPGRTLVFCNSIDCVRRLQSIFHLLHKNIWPLHATMHQRQRLKNLERFTGNHCVKCCLCIS